MISTVYFVTDRNIRLPAKLIAKRANRIGQQIFEMKMANAMIGHVHREGVSIVEAVVGVYHLRLDAARYLNDLDTLVLTVGR